VHTSNNSGCIQLGRMGQIEFEVSLLWLFVP
jgi:hypothetical protein